MDLRRAGGLECYLYPFEHSGGLVGDKPRVLDSVGNRTTAT